MKYNEDDNKPEFVNEIYDMKKVCLAVLPALDVYKRQYLFKLLDGCGGLSLAADLDLLDT